LKELKKIATIQSIGSSTRIEGATLTDEEVKKLLNNIKITKFESREQQEVIGYYETLEIILDNYQDITLSENYIKQLHSILLKESQKDTKHKGKYKNLSNKVVASFPDGTQKIIFNTTETYLVEKEMREIIDWTNKSLLEKEIHPLVIIPLFIYEFLSIHPFQDGNGRLSRLLTTLLLLKEGYSFINYVSFENIVEKYKKDYYESLIEAQRKRNTQEEKIEKWQIFFLNSLEILIKRLEEKYNIYNEKGGYLNDRQKEIKEYILRNEPLKISDIKKGLEKYSINTIKKDVQYLQDENVIEKIGKNKGTIYLIKKTN
ncbi:MAG: Fic family protein, partial [Candidatus Sericytochromatia bacterium]|nr:Fic family protein [Candidatus Sericytochromatia bacterium]